MVIFQIQDTVVVSLHLITFFNEKLRKRIL